MQAAARTILTLLTLAVIAALPAQVLGQGPPAGYLRTPDAAFQVLPDYGWTPQYVHLAESADGARMHHIEAGNPNGEVLLLLHGVPAWSYLWRDVIPPLVADGRFRVIAPDFIGFGRSDKPLDSPLAPTYWTPQRAVAQLEEFMETLDLRDVTLVVHDWGGLVGLVAAARDMGLSSPRIARLCLMNTFLPDGLDLPPPALATWRALVTQSSLGSTPIDVGLVIDALSISALTTAERAAYNAPFPSDAHQSTFKTWTLMVPVPGAAQHGPFFAKARDRLRGWSRPAALVWAPGDPIFGGTDEIQRRFMPASQLEPAVHIPFASHFLQEDGGVAIAQAIIDFVDRRPLSMQLCDLPDVDCGSFEDLSLRRVENGARNWESRHFAAIGDRLDFEIDSPLGDFIAAPCALVVQAYEKGLPPASPGSIRELHVDPTMTPAPILIRAAGLLPARFSIGLPPLLLGHDLVIQGLAFSSLARNGLFATTHAQRIVIRP